MKDGFNLTLSNFNTLGTDKQEHWFEHFYREGWKAAEKNGYVFGQWDAEMATLALDMLKNHVWPTPDTRWMFIEEWLYTLSKLDKCKQHEFAQSYNPQPSMNEPQSNLPKG